MIPLCKKHMEVCTRNMLIHSPGALRSQYPEKTEASQGRTLNQVLAYQDDDLTRTYPLETNNQSE